MEWLLIFVLLIWFIGFMMGSKSAKSPLPANETTIRATVRTELLTLAAKQKDSAVAEGIRKAADHIADTAEPEPALAATTAAAVEPQMNSDIRRAQPIDSANIMLYVGAFLMIAGAGVFVGLSDFSGEVKTIAIAILGIAFYGGGLYLYNVLERLRPAAITITAIGLISLPLTGVAAYNYLNGDAYGSIIWLTTSAICLALYAFAVWKIRQSFIGYLTVFMSLSLWMSIVSVVDAPVYFFGWAAVVLAMVYLLLVKKLNLWRELESPLTVSATIMVPTALILTTLFGGETIDWLHKGITALLATAFYVQALWLTQKPEERRQYFTLANAILPLAIGFIALEISNENYATTAFWVSGLLTLQLLGGGLFKARIHADWLENLSTVTAIWFVVSACLTASSADWSALAWLLGLHIVAHAFGALYLRHRVQMVLGLAATLALPYVAGFMAPDTPLQRDIVVGMYYALGLILMVAAHYADRIVAGYRHNATLSYIVAWILAWLIGLIPSFPLFGSDNLEWLPTASTLALIGCTILSTYYERRPKAILLAGIMSIIGAWQWLDLLGHGQDYGLQALTFTCIGVAFYALGKAHNLTLAFEHYAKAWLETGIGILYIGSLLTTMASFNTFADNFLPSAAGLFLAGGLTCYEAMQRRNRAALYVGIGAMVAATQLVLYHLDITEWQVYSYMWAAYFALLAWLSSKDGREQDKTTFTVLALATQTVPLAIKALDGDTGYGLLLLMESVGIMLLGMIIKYRLVMYWGVAVAVASVLYQLRDYQFFVLVLLGGGIIVVSVLLLLRREKRNQ